MNLEEEHNNTNNPHRAADVLPAERVSNQFVLVAALTAKSVLRYTPAGLPVCEFELEHESTQLEASKARQVKCTVSAVALGVAAQQVDQINLGQMVEWSGFIALRSHKSKGLRFHVCAMRPC
ncbi:primosomal replication protein N [Limnobacter sp.]|uniref:primosomal replication protein N n=1 Tax=Limnobacter sp. TaxID=2003368 RepID=UPI0035196FF6